ncbi:hypothetical protein LINGRAHAP2_LOCUS24814 [Linum grandiflorum]
MDVHKPNVVVLVEPKISGISAERISQRLGFDDVTRVDAVGFTGGIWVLWHRNQVELTRVEASDQFIHFACRSKVMGEFFITAVYGKPSAAARVQLWEDLSRLSIGMQKPWAMAGDFNAMLAPTDKRGGVPLGTNQTAPFLNCCHLCGLSALQNVGPKFTWYRRMVAERLDWALVNMDWGQRFPAFKVFHLPKLYSDHRPILIKDSSAGRTHLPRPFRFMAAWLKHENFSEVLGTAWHNNVDLPMKIRNLAAKLKMWNKITFGNIFERKKQALNHLAFLEAAMETDPSEAKQQEVTAARLCLEKTLWDEELLWIQKARSKASIEGDRNTAFFHNSTIRRREFNRVSRLLNRTESGLRRSKHFSQWLLSFLQACTRLPGQPG